MLGISHITNKYSDINKDCDDDDIDNTTDIPFQINERSTKQKLNVILDNVSLERFNSTKYLGVDYHENLTWKNHINVVSQTTSRNIGMLTKTKHYVPRYISYSLYCTLVLPYINYGILIWGNTCKTYLKKILKLQKWAIRTISLWVLQESHRISCLRNTMSRTVLIHINSNLVLMYKHQTKLLPQTFSNHFIKHNQIHKYSTRNDEDYSIHKAKKMFSDRSIRITGQTLWNSLNTKFKHCKTTKHFRNEFKSSFINYYSWI